MNLRVAPTGTGWIGKLGRGAAVLMLLGSAACQQSGPPTGGGMFGTGGAPANNASAAAPAAPAPAPAAQAPAPVAAMSNMAAPVAAAPPIAAVPANTQDRRVRITNQSGLRVTLIKGSPANQNNWGQDRIPSGTLPSGNAVIVDFNDNNGECVYDLQATLEDGTTREQARVNICQIADWVITTDGTMAR